MTDTTPPAAVKAFDPARHLSKVGSADYLEVKWRLVWLREAHPDAQIATELVSDRDQRAVFKALVSLPSGGSATGYGSEQIEDFREYLEKAETKAIGRALAALGFGTAFCADHEHGGLVDSPVNRGTEPRQYASAPRPAGGAGGGGAPSLATPKQIKFIEALARDRDMSDEALATQMQALYGKPLGDLTSREASNFIEQLQGTRGREVTR